MISKEMPLGSFIRHHRKCLGISISELVNRLKKRVSCSYIHCVEMRGDIPSPSMLQALALELELDIEKLVALALKAKLERAEKAFKKKYTKT